MASIVSLLVIALSVSLDGFGVGMLYAARGIRIPAGSLLVIAGCSGGLLYAAMLAGDWLALRLTPQSAARAGAAILVAVGLWSIVQFFRSQHAERPDGGADSRGRGRASAARQPDAGRPGAAEHGNRRAESASGNTDDTDATSGATAGHRSAVGHPLRPARGHAGVVVDILRMPTAADVDRSGNISAAEAALLGVALSLDAIGAGVGAALVGYGAAATALSIAAASGMFVRLGTLLGRRMTGRLSRRLAVLPGFLLIGVGLVKLLQL